MSWIQTFTGKKVFPLAMTAEMVCVDDIAHALSMKCRFTGHCREFYSIAEHSVRVSLLVRPELRLAALLHDAAEAYLPDLARPIKSQAFFRLSSADVSLAGAEKPLADGQLHLRTFFDDASKRRHEISVASGLWSVSMIEDRILSVIWSAFNVEGFSSAAIKQADNIMLATEARDLMGEPPEPWALDVPLLPEVIKPWPASVAKDCFRLAFEAYAHGHQVVYLKDQDLVVCGKEFLPREDN